MSFLRGLAIVLFLAALTDELLALAYVRVGDAKGARDWRNLGASRC